MRSYSSRFTGLLLTGLAFVACSPKYSLSGFDDGDSASSSGATEGASSTSGTAGSSGTSDNPSTSGTSSASTSTSGDSSSGVASESDSSSDATSSGSSDTGSTGSGGGPLHASCEAPAPDPLPPLPHVTMVDGMPAFAEWQALACDDAAVTGELSCGADGDCPGNNCVNFGGDAGVCSYPDIDVWCDGEGQVMGTSDGSCWICLEPSQHAKACCEDQDGFFDCRAWPFTDTPGIVGQVCAVHEDCEPGLVCSEPKWSTNFQPNGQFCFQDEDCDAGVCDDLFHECGTEVPHYAGYGICACPGTDSNDIVPGDACF